MTTSTIANREPAQATATEQPEPPKKAKVGAPKPRVTQAKVKSGTRRPRPRRATKRLTKPQRQRQTLPRGELGFKRRWLAAQ